MSFGQRTNSKLRATSRSTPTPSRSHADDAQEQDDLPVTKILTYTAPLVVIFAALFIYRSLGPAPVVNTAQFGSAPVIAGYNYGSETMEFVMDRPGGKGGLSYIDAEINRACLPATIGAKYRDALLIQSDGGEGSPRSVKMKLRLASSGAYLACTMGVETNRLCQPFYRQRLVERLKAYADLRDRMRGKTASTTPAGWQQVFLAEADGPEGSIDPNPEWIGLGRPVGMALRDLSSAGRILASDFGSWGAGMPAAIAQHMREAKVTVQCN